MKQPSQGLGGRRAGVEFDPFPVVPALANEGQDDIIADLHQLPPQVHPTSSDASPPAAVIGRGIHAVHRRVVDVQQPSREREPEMLPGDRRVVTTHSYAGGRSPSDRNRPGLIQHMSGAANLYQSPRIHVHSPINQRFMELNTIYLY